MNSESSSPLAAAAYKDFGYRSAAAWHTHRYLMPALLSLGGERLRPGTRILDVGCGNGFNAGQFLARGCRVVGIDLSESGIAIAREPYPRARFELLPAEDKLLENLPRKFVAGCYAALKPAGRFIVSTPYHRYLKNLSIALLNRCDQHANPVADGGHIKFWSKRTLSALLRESGFCNLHFRGSGRLPFLWKSMLMAADRPSG